MQTNQPRQTGAGTTSSGSVEPSEKAKEMVDQAQEKAQEMVGHAQKSAQTAAGRVQSRVRDRVHDKLEQGRTRAADQVISQASDLRAVGSSLREQANDGPAQAAERLARIAERTGGYLRDNRSDALLGDAEDFARRQPWAVAAGGLALGFAASRFLKASSRKRYSSQAEERRAPRLPERPEGPAHAALRDTPTTLAGQPAVSAGPASSASSVPPRKAATPSQSPPMASQGPSITGGEQWER
jgi:ElaB/YqjD/DUF883 family membrane-anchored ribosome-binding protein